MGCYPASCPDCPYPPNLMVTELTKNSEGIMRYEVDCRECGEVWVELDETATN
jgi:uncharacterized Zn finger protein